MDDLIAKVDGLIRLAEARHFGSVNFQLNTITEELRNLREAMVGKVADEEYDGTDDERGWSDE